MLINTPRAAASRQPPFYRQTFSFVLPSLPLPTKGHHLVLLMPSSKQDSCLAEFCIEVTEKGEI